MGNDNAQTAAQRAGISSSNFSRWKKGANADPEFVVKIARAYHANVLEALVEAEFITEQEAGLKEIQVGKTDLLRSLTIEELTDALQRKVEAEKNAVRFTTGMSPAEVEEQVKRLAEMGFFPDNSIVSVKYRDSRKKKNNVYPLTSLGQAQRVAEVDVQALIKSDEPYAANTDHDPRPEDDHGWDA